MIDIVFDIWKEQQKNAPFYFAAFFSVLFLHFFLSHIGLSSSLLINATECDWRTFHRSKKFKIRKESKIVFFSLVLNPVNRISVTRHRYE